MRFLSTLFFLLTVTGCMGAKPMPSYVNDVAFTKGTLYVDPSSDRYIRDGKIEYRLYEDGMVTYHGEVEYRLTASGDTTFYAPFSGRVKLKDGIFLSAHYAEEDAVLRERQVEARVLRASATAAKLGVAVVDPVQSDSPDASGTIVLDTTGDIVKLKSVKLRGTLLNVKRVELDLADTPFIQAQN